MILESLQQPARYLGLHPGMQAAIEFLRREDLHQLPNGRQEIDGERLFAIVAREQGRGREQSPLEYHRRYFDVQYVISGTDCIGWRPTLLCERTSIEYDPEKDLGFFADRPDTWITVPAGHFVVLFPEDAHAPLASEGPIHKVVVKVRVEWEA